MEMLCLFTVILGVAALVALAALHFLSPEYAPSWRMISEYALGRHKWAITAFFLLWGGSSFTLGAALWPAASTIWIQVGVILLLLSGLGAVMGGLFDVKHKLHGFSFMLGVPTLPVAALLISYGLQLGENGGSLRLLAHGTWVSVVLMGATMGIMMAGFKKAGIPMGPDVEPPKVVPAGVIAVAGWANRLLVLCYIGWSLMMAALGLGWI